MLDDILDSFSLSRPVSVKQINTGLVNQTYKIMNSDGVFALQSLHTVFPDETLEDMHVVTDYLSQHGMRVPTLMRTKDGEFFMLDHNNLRWRLYSWIEGRVHDAVVDEAMAHEAGKIVGTMHRILADIDYKPQGTIPHFHDTVYILKQLESVFAQLPPEAQVIARDILTEAPSTLIDENELPPQVIHGDLKISNLLFDEDNHAIGIIDFDTLLWKPKAIDMGDALRSWCNRTTEDDPQAVFDSGLFEAAETGYSEGLHVTVDLRPVHRQAAKQIAFELSARFFTDMVTDNYFSFDAARYPSRKAHNFARAMSQYHLAKSI
jgi:Ser/Thr protein kinase RdoA (MazF antagonist)